MNEPLTQSTVDIIKQLGTCFIFASFYFLCITHRIVSDDKTNNDAPHELHISHGCERSYYLTYLDTSYGATSSCWCLLMHSRRRLVHGTRHWMLVLYKQTKNDNRKKKINTIIAFKFSLVATLFIYPWTEAEPREVIYKLKEILS
jgi:hypothetical protein